MPSAPGAARKGRLLVALFKVLGNEPEGLQAKDAIQAVRNAVELAPEEEGTFEQSGLEKFPHLLRFSTIPAVKAGWLKKDDGVWSLSEDGKSALASYPDPATFYKEARKRYLEWKKTASLDLEDSEETEVEVTEAVSLEESEDSARAEILTFLGRMPPFDFQKACAALVEALGHEVRWISDPGPDGGLDFIAYSDPIGATGRRIKGQVKRQQSKQDVDDVGAFLSKLGPTDAGLFIALGGFTKPAAMQARADDRRLVLLDGPDFVRLWIKHYHALEEEALNLLRLRPIWHLVRPTE
jgi:restriction system protein